MVRRLLPGIFRRWLAANSRELIVNADDFGMSASITRGIITAHERGIVTSASLMVRREAARAAADYARCHPTLSVGLHVDLGEWLYRDGSWQPLYVVVDLQDADAVTHEVRRQLDVFAELTGARPTHLDSHQHVHREEPVWSILFALARELDVPLRHGSPHVRYCGEFYAQAKYGVPDHDAVGVTALSGVIARLPPGTTELCCHPGDEVQVGEQYGEARRLELETLCDPRIRRAVADHHVTLRSFRGLTAQPRP